MLGLVIPTIIDKKAKSMKLINNRPGYDMRYVESYIYNYCSINNYQQFFDDLFEIERQYDTLSIIRPHETPREWGKFVDHDYYRPRIHKTRMAICLDCWKLIQVNDEKPKKQS
ncbi:hypothetical protein C2G38_2215627 [Gigaspora rosea]|uniref:Uncharacterized protein n=1 Tax=Gigaspora rosea TaxID=44941 RepID=A0A397U9N0_9GLOM|nr:hypothetical protein C2G38_2215627 [Gigaspora rosea]